MNIVDNIFGRINKLVNELDSNSQNKEDAKAELEQIFNTHESFTARYLACRALKKDLDKVLPDWIEKLRSILLVKEKCQNHETIKSAKQDLEFLNNNIADEFIRKDIGKLLNYFAPRTWMQMRTGNK